MWAVQAKAEAHRSLGQLEQATTCYYDTRDTARRLGCKLELAHSHLGLAEIARQQGKPKPRAYAAALRIYQKLAATWGIHESRSRIRLSSVATTLSSAPFNFP